MPHLPATRRRLVAVITQPPLGPDFQAEGCTPLFVLGLVDGRWRGSGKLALFMPVGGGIPRLVALVAAVPIGLLHRGLAGDLGHRLALRLRTTPSQCLAEPAGLRMAGTESQYPDS